MYKPGYPIRPIVSFIDSPTYQLAKYLSKILIPITDLSDRKMRNSQHAKEILQGQTVPLNYNLVSFDVKNLFTCIQIDFALQCVEERLNEPDVPENLKPIPTEVLISMLKLCMASNTFQWNQQVYEQKQGTPMGSPISVAIAELTMQKIEKMLFCNLPCSVNLWIRYVDDVLAIIPTEHNGTLLTHLNSLNEHIQFTYEKETHSSLPYLDLLINHKEDGSLRFSVYRKPTNTGKHLDFFSFHPLSQKRSVSSSLYKRAKDLCSEDTLQDEYKIVERLLVENNYPTQFAKLREPSRNERNVHQPERKKFISTPYIKGVSERVERILKPHNIMLAHKSKTTIKTKLCHLKDSREATEKNNAVYKINCKNCSCSYIGETSKKVGDRLKEHKRNITNAYEQSQIFQHIRDSGHTFNFKEVQVIQQSKNVHTRRQLEAFYSETTDNTINRHVDVDRAILPIIKKFR